MDKQTEIYKTVIRAQSGNNTDIAKVIYVLFKDKLICKHIGRQTVWYEKTTDNEYSIIHEYTVKKKVFEIARRTFYQTADFLYGHAFNEDFTLHKPHYLTIANLIMKASMQFSIHAARNNIMKELKELLFV